jgi:hypothetical protein
MRTHVLTTFIAGLALLATSCASTTGSEVLETVDEPASTTSTTQTSAPTSTAVEPSAPEPTEAVDPQLVEKYLTTMSNLQGDLLDALSAFEQTFNDSFWGEDDVDADEPSPEDMVRYFKGYFGGTYDLQLSHAIVLSETSAPEGFEDAHEAYVGSYQALIEHLKDTMAGMSTHSEIDEFVRSQFGDPDADITADLAALNLAYIDTCRALELTATEAGYDVSMGCPVPPAETATIAVDIGMEWSAVPESLPAGDLIVEMVLTNVGDEPVQPVVVVIFEGDASALPTVGGIVDLSQSGVGQAGVTSFGLLYPGDHDIFTEGDSDVTGEVPVLEPGDSVTIEFFTSSTTIVVFDYGQGKFEAGSYIVIEQA